MNKATHMFPLKRSSSNFNLLPPDTSELRVVLLGNSWSQRSSVGNLMLKETVFNTDEERGCCLRFRRQMEKKLVVINTPDLLHPDISEHKVTEHMKTCVRLSDPGPHVFLLVLQPEDFTEELKLRLFKVLKLFSDQSFDHSLVLTSAQYQHHPQLKDLIIKCRNRHLNLKNLDRPELLTRLGQVVKENNGEHVHCEMFEDPMTTLPTDHQSPKHQTRSTSIRAAVKAAVLHMVKQTTSLPAVSRERPSHTSGLRIVLLGKSDDTKTKLQNFIMRGQSFQDQKSNRQCEAVCGEWRGKPLTVVKTPDMLSLEEEIMRREVKSCVSLCSPGPNVLLMLVKPSDFTEENRQTLKFILSLFGEDAFRFSMVIVTHGDGRESLPLKNLIEDCGPRQYQIVNFDKKDLPKNDHRVLMQKMETIVSDNKGGYLMLMKESNVSKPSLNLVLCGSRAAEKTSAAEAILGQTELHSVSSSSECVKHQGEVCGRWVSLVELPALSGKPQEEVMKESFRCISLCDPEGVNAFILVLPVGPLTDEDKVELETIQKTFSSRVNDFTMILFTVESDPKHPTVVNFVKGNSDVQRISQSCGGRSVVLNIKDKQQIPELLETVEKMRHINKPCGYTRETFTCSKMDEILELKKIINTLEAELKDLKTKTMMSLETQSPESLRIVLLGKTGCGKSSSGNTILGRKEFKADLSQKSVTRYCHKSESKVDGRHMVVVDTPGLFDSNLSHHQVYEEMVKCISLLAPGPHVFLLVLKIDRFTPEEKETLALIKQGFGKNSEKFTIVLLTGGDSLEKDDLSIEEYIDKKCDDSFKELINDYGGRYHVFNNNDEQNHTQVSELIKKMDTMVKENGGSCFTNEMLQEAEAAIKKEMEKNLKEKEEEMKREREELERKHEEEREEMKRIIEEIEKERKVREQKLKEMEENIKKEREERKREKETREEEDRKRKQEEERQRLKWEQEKEALETREEMNKKREAWEKERQDWWKRRDEENEQKQWEEDEILKKLQEEYEQEKLTYEKERKEEERKRQEQEKERKELEEKYKTKMEEMKKTQEDEARRRAVEMNEFRQEYMEESEDQNGEPDEEQHKNKTQLSRKKEEELTKRKIKINELKKEVELKCTIL